MILIGGRREKLKETINMPKGPLRKLLEKRPKPLQRILRGKDLDLPIPPEPEPEDLIGDFIQNFGPPVVRIYVDGERVAGVKIPEDEDVLVVSDGEKQTLNPEYAFDVHLNKGIVAVPGEPARKINWEG